MKYKRYQLIYLLLFLFINATASLPNKRHLTIMLDPIGDARYTGHIIDNHFEKTLTLEFTKYIKQAIELNKENVRVIITRFPGEILEPLQNASFANRLNVDFYISISFYKNIEETSNQSDYNLAIYRFSYNNQLDKFNNFNKIEFYPYHKAYKHSLKNTEKYCKLLNDIFNKNHENYNFKGLFALPCKPLIGINAPSFLYEMNIYNKDDIKKWINPCLKSIYSLIDFKQQIA